MKDRCWQNIGVNKILASTKHWHWQNIGMTIYWCWQNIMLTKYWRRQNIGVDKILASTKHRHRQNYIKVQWSIFLLFSPGKVHSIWLLSDLTGILLKVLSPPCLVAEWKLQPVGQLIWVDFLQHCPSLFPASFLFSPSFLPSSSSLSPLAPITD
jgi:hypothetical protein